MNYDLCQVVQMMSTISILLQIFYFLFCDTILSNDAQTGITLLDSKSRVECLLCCIVNRYLLPLF